MQGGDEKSVIAARLVTGNRAERISADAVGHQPLARFRCRKVAANLAATIDDAGKFGHETVGGRRNPRIM